MESENTQTTKEHILRETAKIPWQELQRFFAAGNAIFVNGCLDLIDVASVCRKDEATTLQQWMQDGLVHAVTDEQAQHWLDIDNTVWAVVVAPWVLVQEQKQ